ncbi:MAG TPA: transposase [Chitinophagaceae bacterium]|nr:transposase [Chitinophagaceae bacterium]
MERKRRKFSVEEKLQIIQEAEEMGITPTLRKYNLANSLLLRWRSQFNSNGVAGLKPKYHRVDPQLRALEDENARLKKIIANQALELEFKSELLKKTGVVFGKPPK